MMDFDLSFLGDLRKFLGLGRNIFAGIVDLFYRRRDVMQFVS